MTRPALARLSELTNERIRYHWMILSLASVVQKINNDFLQPQQNKLILFLLTLHDFGFGGGRAGDILAWVVLTKAQEAGGTL